MFLRNSFARPTPSIYARGQGLRSIYSAATAHNLPACLAIELFEHVKECMGANTHSMYTELCVFQSCRWGSHEAKHNTWSHTAVEKFQCRQMLEMARRRGIIFLKNTTHQFSRVDRDSFDSSRRSRMGKAMSGRVYSEQQRPSVSKMANSPCTIVIS